MLGFTSLALVHYSLTVPSEIAGCGCVTQLHTHTHTCKQKSAHTFIFNTEAHCCVLCFFMLEFLSLKVVLFCPRGRDRQREREISKPLSNFLHLSQDKNLQLCSWILCSVTNFVLPFSNGISRSAALCLAALLFPFSDFQFLSFEYAISDDPVRNKQHKKCAKKSLNCILVLWFRTTLVPAFLGSCVL